MTMPRRAAILILARTGKNVAEIAAATGLSRKWVHAVAWAAGVKLTRLKYRRHRGVATLVRKARRNRTPLYRMAIPLTALRAAGLDGEKRLAYRVVAGTVVFGKVSEGMDAS